MDKTELQKQKQEQRQMKKFAPLVANKVEWFHLKKKDGSEKWNKIIEPLMVEITYYDADGKIVDFKERELFRSIIEMILKSSDTVTILVESGHIDEAYTDTFYNYFSGLHFPPSKYCKRFSFFKSAVIKQYFVREELHERLQENLIGTMVIRPIKYGFIGRTLLDPAKLAGSNSNKDIYIRTAKFTQHILGVEFTIDAFPFCSQDSSFMTCAEVTILNLMEYYAMRYHSYRKVLPSDIKNLSQRYQYERVTPSAGLTYLVVSKILSEFGFTPRLYNRESVKIQPLIGDERENEIKRIMHYYVESGIPVAVNVEPEKGDIREGHSLLCIGHTGKIDEKRAQKYAMARMNGKHEIINSADFYVHYCVIDDHQKPYEIREYGEMSTFSDMVISNLAVPLNKKMYLEAKYAYDIFYQVFYDEALGLVSWKIPKEYLSEDDPVVMRIYQASSRSYRSFKITAYDDSYSKRKAMFAELKLPQFVWCCEFFKYEQYVSEDRKAFANVILDATASLKEDYTGAVIAVETVDTLFRIARNGTKLQKGEAFDMEKFDVDRNLLLPIYNCNLTRYDCGEY